MTSSVILSICIPTFNRDSYLKKTLDSIVSQNIFKDTNFIEIIISDNNSEDETRNISLKYTIDYPGKVKYFKNEYNIGDLNFEKSLSYGQGLYLKLNNDTLIHKSNSLEKMISFIESNKFKKNILFFLNQNLNTFNNRKCVSIDSFIRESSFWSGWIGGFGIWKSDFLSLDKFREDDNSNLAQISVNLKLSKSDRTFMINNERLFILNAPSRKGGYDLLNVFLDEYLSILNKEVLQNRIKRKTYYIEKRKILLNLILPWLVELQKKESNISFSANNKWPRIFKEYKSDLITFILFSLLYFARNIKSHLESIVINKSNKT
jgi:abequosyltransferase